MLVEIGHVEAIFRYPVKSMAGEALEAADVSWYGLEGDRRLALRRMEDRGGMPWLTAGKLPELVCYVPYPEESGPRRDLPTHVRTPEGELLPVFGQGLGQGLGQGSPGGDLAAEVSRRYGAPVQLMQLRHGIFDEACISVIASDTVREIGRLASLSLDVRRFRPNVVVRLGRAAAFQEDEWVGGVITFGGDGGERTEEGRDSPAVTITMRDERCSMVNLDPDMGSIAPEVMKAVVRANENHAGVYGAITRVGRLAVGQSVYLSRG